MKLKHLLTAAVIFSSVSATSTHAETPQELAQQYVEMPAVQEMITAMFSPETAVAQIKAVMGSAGNLDEQKDAELGKVVSESLEVLRPVLIKVMVETTANTFTKEEIQALIAFYQSEHGAAVMKKMPVYQQKTMQTLAPYLQQMITTLIPKVDAIIHKK